MKRFTYIALLLLVSFSSAFAAPRDEQWKKVDEAIGKGLPKSAIEALEPIKGALEEEKYGEAIKAIARKIVLEGNIQGNKPEEKITRLENEIETAPAQIKPLLRTLLAHWYWHYFQQNKWRFMQRTATAEAPGKDFTTWDLARLFAEIDKHFRSALAEEKVLKKIPVAEFSDVLQKGTLPDAYRPTLYDFIAHEALEFYASGEQAGAKPQDDFELSNDILFAPAEKFMAMKPKVSGDQAASAKFKAFRLYQDLLRFHARDEDKAAFIDVDIARLIYGKNVGFGEDKSERFKTAMQAVAEKWNRHELAAFALYHVALAWQDEGDLGKAHTLAKAVVSDYPKSNGAQLCRSLVSEIEAKSASITTERIWNAPAPEIQVQYRNVDAVYFRAIPHDWSESIQKRRRVPGYLDDEQRKELLQAEPALEWSHKLPVSPDFEERTKAFPAPLRLKPGFYYIMASHLPDFSQAANQISVADVWVSDLAFITRNREHIIEGFVLKAESGEPIEGATVEGWVHNYQRDRLDPIKAMTTDANGMFQFTPEQQRNYIFKANYNGHEIGTQNEVGAHHHWRGVPGDQTVFFTDRSIYRPGQTISYKGICLRVDQEKNNYGVLPGQHVEVAFLDANGQEILRQKHQCNDVGSFTGNFTAPRDRLMGAMQIVAHGPTGSTHFRVEEYKRPKFQVTLDAPRTAPKLNEKVELTGHAMSYTGAAIDNSSVKYRVVREVRWPIWYYWGRHGFGGPAGETQEIVHGDAKTEVDGSFKIEFVAKPDPSISPTNEPTFVYRVYADVTDSAGETRSDERTVNVGYTALQASLAAPTWIEQNKSFVIDATTLTLDGEPQSASGVLKIYSLNAPERVHRPLSAGHEPFRNRFGRGIKPVDPGTEEPDLSDPNNWPLDVVVLAREFSTDKEGKAAFSFKLKTGAYRAVLETKDRFGKKVTALLPLTVLDPGANKLAIKVPNLVLQKTNSFSPGEEFLALWGTGYDKGRAYIEIEHHRKLIRRYWTKPGVTQHAIKLAVSEAMRGGFTLHVTQVRENRGYLVSQRVEVPWSNKELDIRWEHFTSKLEPNQKETWTAIISTSTNSAKSSSKKGEAETSSSPERIAAEMVATLYDKSLDAFAPHPWMQRFGMFRQEQSGLRSHFENIAKQFQPYWHDWYSRVGVPSMTYRSFPPDLTENYRLYGFARRKGMQTRTLHAEGITSGAEAAAPSAVAADVFFNTSSRAVAQKSTVVNAGALKGEAKEFGGEQSKQPEPAESAEPDLSKVSARKNLNETAFFFPQLTGDSNGVVKMTFTMPEALTEWRFMGFAHDKDVRSGFIEGTTVTTKDLMVQPNPPRFLREGDEVEFTVKVSNQSDVAQKGKVQLTFANGLTETSADSLVGNKSTEQTFDIPSKESRTFSWRITAPEGLSVLTYKAVGATTKLSDGEEGFLPVLSRRIFVTESLPLPIRGPGEKNFAFTKLLESGKSDTLKHENLTVQMVSNPAWYAVMALPYLMEFPYECSEQTFNRLYANALARFISASDPKIERVFEQWRGTTALDSPLEKNQELKSVVLEETPWVRQSQDESQARKNVGILFDNNRLNHETESTLRKLDEMQNDDGSWPWFPGGPGNDYITLYITTGFGRLRHLGVEMDVQPALRSLNRLDGWIAQMHKEIVTRGNPEANNLSPTIALYLYGRSFFLKDKGISKRSEEAIDYFVGQARKHWLALDNRQSQGHLAIALNRFDDQKTARGIMASIKERSVSDEELGMFWRDLELSWWWFRAPIETQALMIEAFDEVMNDKESVEGCKIWLLKQKQTQDWKTTKATADAVYALLLRGTSQLVSDALVEVKLAGQEIKPEKVEAGTGFYEQRFTGPEVRPELGQVTVKKVDEGVAWGSVHWQYMEDMTKVTPHEGTPLKLKKTLFKKVNTTRGPELQPIKGALDVGDELVVRIELRTDRDMEYMHMKDQRGSGTEPVNVLSKYKYQDGLAYYESTRDTASHFFIDYLPKGVYVFEYSTRVQLRGNYQSGIAEIQCMYAPEFNSHSESFPLTVK